MDLVETAETRVCISAFFFFFFTYFRSIFLLFIHCYGYCLWTVAVKFDFFYFSAQILLFIDPQILLFNNFFIKNRSHSTINTFKIILLQYFSVFSFSFQFSAVSKRTLTLWSHNFISQHLKYLVVEYSYKTNIHWARNSHK